MRYFIFLSITLVFVSLEALGQQGSPLTFYFSKGSSKLDSAQMEVLEKALDSMKVTEHCRFIIRGYTDNEGTKRRNGVLSQERAQAVSDYLVSRGYDSAGIDAQGIGQTLDSTVILSEYEKGQNRKVIIRFVCQSSLTTSDIRNTPTQAFENDTIIYGAKGTQVLIKREAFYPRKIKDVKITINEMFSLCDSIPDDVLTVTETGVCLASGGMVFVQAEYKKRPIKPGRKAMFEVRIPVNNNDTTNNFYVAVRQKDGTLRWRERKGDIITDNGKKYYVFETNVLGGFNCDVPIPGCNIDGVSYYTIKTWTQSSSVRFYFNNQFSFFTARNIKRRKYAIPSTVSPEQIYIAASGYKYFYFPQYLLDLMTFNFEGDNNDFITKKVYRLSDLKYKPGRKLYKLKKRNFELGYTRQLRDRFRQTMKCK